MNLNMEVFTEYMVTSDSCDHLQPVFQVDAGVEKVIHPEMQDGAIGSNSDSETASLIEGITSQVRTMIDKADSAIRHPEKILRPKVGIHMLYIPQGKPFSLVDRVKLVGLRLIERMNKLSGPAYLMSGRKRAFELSVALPSAIVATPAILIFGLIQKIYDGGSMFYKHQVLSPDGSTFNLIKIRTMRDGNGLSDENLHLASLPKPEDDPRVFGLGSLLRRFELDELPQFWQVVAGRLSLIATRPITLVEKMYILRTWSEERKAKWLPDYEKRVPGLSGINQAFNPNKKRLDGRYRLDIFGVENASLGMDIYCIWRTILRMLKIRPNSKQVKR